ncbi:uncharacterized protein AMSG_08117 [Thecamonas trahens ATCC 50062]|uniref:Guanylate cyclase domain-containing protein n=1 Tax=Thecamonas trahens ATCC 50062 TaxID=461836 RepID=A0A0L0DJZ7_THETB|nr:hypothetical protein AMSG_08117 [Thecamonas trahens ATCC 50062]KNC52550.1 hypothetical protein AMSG_08117 [Thecamonas trahens ATCC 50062]|eukprot:XP_013755340.1 hypothetical protein AMSG_08117 [Thecamonas trahens ATCC 50062]
MCFGDDSALDACGVCFGDNACLDACGIQWGDNSTCAGCDGVPHSNKVRDVCGVCDGDGSSCLGCDGMPIPLGGGHYDACGVCGGTAVGTCYDSCDPLSPVPVVFDCAGVCNGSAYVDECGVCVNGTTGRTPLMHLDDCDVCFDRCEGCIGGLVPDSCGICGGDGSTCLGCDGLGSVVDLCGVCNGTNACIATCNAGISSTAAYDCAGVCGGDAFLNACGFCVGGTTGLAPSTFVDVCDVCFGGGRDLDSCGVCFGNNANRDECGVCLGGNRAMDSCGVCFGGESLLDVCGVCRGNGTTCAGCDSISNSGLEYDSCGVCGGASTCRAQSSTAAVGSAMPIVAASSSGLLVLIIAGLGFMYWRRRRRFSKVYIEEKAQAAAAEAPSGTIAVMITDVQSSTYLWEAYPEEMVTAIDDHNTAFRAKLDAHNGYIIRTEGDSFVVAFDEAADAVAAAVAIQIALYDLEWPAGILADKKVPTVDGVFRGLRVRMGIHVCSPARAFEERTQRFVYTGPTMIDAQRIGDCGTGGQVVVDAAAAAAAADLGFTTGSLGEYRAESELEGSAKNESSGEQIDTYQLSQVVVPGLEARIAAFAELELRGLERVGPATLQDALQALQTERLIASDGFNTADSMVIRQLDDEETATSIETGEPGFESSERSSRRRARSGMALRKMTSAGSLNASTPSSALRYVGSAATPTRVASSRSAIGLRRQRTHSPQALKPARRVLSSPPADAATLFTALTSAAADPLTPDMVLTEYVLPALARAVASPRVVGAALASKPEAVVTLADRVANAAGSRGLKVPDPLLPEAYGMLLALGWSQECDGEVLARLIRRGYADQVAAMMVPQPGLMARVFGGAAGASLSPHEASVLVGSVVEMQTHMGSPMPEVRALAGVVANSLSVVLSPTAPLTLTTSGLEPEFYDATGKDEAEEEAPDPTESVAYVIGDDCSGEGHAGSSSSSSSSSCEFEAYSIDVDGPSRRRAMRKAGAAGSGKSERSGIAKPVYTRQALEWLRQSGKNTPEEADAQLGALTALPDLVRASPPELEELGARLVQRVIALDGGGEGESFEELRGAALMTLAEACDSALYALADGFYGKGYTLSQRARMLAVVVEGVRSRAEARKKGTDTASTSASASDNASGEDGAGASDEVAAARAAAHAVIDARLAAKTKYYHPLSRARAAREAQRAGKEEQAHVAALDDERARGVFYRLLSPFDGHAPMLLDLVDSSSPSYLVVHLVSAIGAVVEAAGGLHSVRRMARDALELFVGLAASSAALVRHAVIVAVCRVAGTVAGWMLRTDAPGVVSELMRAIASEAAEGGEEVEEGRRVALALLGG